MADVAVNGQAVDFSARLNGGLIRIYDGTQPATADTALGTQVLGVTLTFNATAFGAPVSGLLTANAITAGTAVASITPTWARCLNAAGTVVIMDISAGTSASNLIIGAFTSGTVVSATTFTHDVRNATAGV